MKQRLASTQRLLTGEPVSFAGSHIIVDKALIRPTPSIPVPLIVAGRSAAAQTRAARLGDGWLGIWTSPSRYAEATAGIAEQAVAAGRNPAALQHGLNVWCGLAANRNRANDAVARAMHEVYQLPYAAFERWSPAGTPGDVADFLAPYLAAACTTFNLIACGDDTDTVIELAAQVRTLLLGGSVVTTSRGGEVGSRGGA